MIYQNYHRHSHYSNVRISDSVVKNEDYARRAQELSHSIISTMEHGWQGRYIEGYELAAEYNLKFLFGTEAYWVKDRHEKDNTNAHICLLAKNENGRQAINDILSEANITGFYYQPRIDLELLFSLPPEDVWVTTACAAFWKYEDINDIVLRMHKYFGNNFFLEVQSHNVENQSDLNRRIIDLSNRHNMRIIAGVDSHYILDSTAWERDEYIKSKGIKYEEDEERNWFMDYPDGDTLFRRFMNQGALTEAQIKEAIENTNVFLEVEEYDNPCFNKEIKMITLYPDLTQEEKNKKYTDLIWKNWEKEKHKKPKKMLPEYEKEIQKEIDAVIVTDHADYFLYDYEMIRRAIEKGGILTKTGRGSGPSYFTNNLLGLTKIDRINAAVKMYPERFISPTRIIESKSLADLDLNTGNPEVFAEAQTEVFTDVYGEDGKEYSYPMIAYGTLKAKSAWKMYAKAKGIDFDLANMVSEQIEKYEAALKYANEEDEREDINIYDYIDKEYHQILKDSESYLGIVSDYKIHPCAYLLYIGNIRKEIGLIKASKQDTICTIMDGKWAEEYRFFKNDLLKVTVVEIIDKTYQKLGIEPHDENELLELCGNNEKVWEVYANGWTMGINQVEQTSTRHKATQYKPKNISELCAFVAAVRPGFKSMYNIFEKREPFSYDIPTFDNLIQTPEMPNSFLLYQEMAMSALNYAGIPMSDCYDVIKHIAKKRAKEVKKYKDQFMVGFKERLIEVENIDEESAQEATEKVWHIIDDSCDYSFNAAHAYSVAIDSLYGAYLKSHYPLQFYEVLLNVLDEKGTHKKRMTQVRKEAESAYGIRFVPMRFRQDNRKITANVEDNSIQNTLSVIKGFGDVVAEQLYELKDNQYDTFVDLLIDMEEKKILSKKIEDLIMIQYFDEFGQNGKLLKIYQEFTSGDNRYKRTHKDATKEKRIVALKEIEANLPDERIPLVEQMAQENKLLGYIQVTFDVEKNYVYIADVNTKFAPRLDCYCLANGKTESMKIQRLLFNDSPLSKGDIIYIYSWQAKPRLKYDKGKFVEIPGTKEWWITAYDRRNHEFQ